MSDLSDTTGVILAGGLGTRLRPVVPDRPKVLAEVRRRPFLEYLLDQLVAVAIRDVVLCTGHRGEQVRESFGDQYRSLRLSYSHESFPLGTGGALRLALPLVRSDVILVMNGDSYCNADLKAFFTWHRARGARASILLAHRDETERFGRIDLHPDGRILQFHEKDGRGTPGWINAGVYLIDRSLLAGLPEGASVSLERDLFPFWANQGLYGCCGGEEFLDIGIPETYAAADRFFIKGGCT